MVAHPESALAPLPLATLHRRLGATLGAVGGFAAPLDYGSYEEEYRALGERAAWVDRGWVSRLELTGDDRARLLGGLTSCDVKGLEAGHGTYGFFTGPQGKILADGWVLALEDRLWLELPPGSAATVGDHIRRYIIADQVEVSPLAQILPISLIGPAAPESLASFCDLPAADEGGPTLRSTALFGVDVQCVHQQIAGLPALTLWIPGAVANDFMEELLARTNLPAAGWRALEARRIAAGVPAFGRDFTSDHFPQESGREGEGVSYTKGCYLGQEIVARIHYRGGVNRAMCRLRFEPTLPDPATALTLDGIELGQVGSTVALPGTDQRLGFAVIQHQAAVVGTRLALADGAQAEVTAVLTELKD